MKKERKNNKGRNLDFGLEEEIRKLNEVSQRYSRMNQEIANMEQELPDEEYAADAARQAQADQVTEDLRRVRKSLEIVKGEVSMAGTEVRSIQKSIEKAWKRSSRNIWKIAAVLELVCLVAGGAAFFISQALKEPEAKPAGPGIESQEPAPTNPPEEKKTSFYIKDLKERAAALSRDEIAPFEVSVEEIDGLENLCFTYQDLKISYANEYWNESSGQQKKIRLETAERLAVYPWDYDLTENLAALAPEYGDYTGEEGYQLIFMQYNDNNKKMPNIIRMLDAERLWEYDVFYVQEALAELFTPAYSQVPQENGSVIDTRMELVIGSAAYQYAIAQNTYVNAVYYGSDVLCFDEYFVLETDGEKMAFNAVVYTPDKEYLGEISGEIAAVDREVVLKNVRFGAYVTPYQEDITSDGIIVPRSSRMVEHITITGNNRERYYIALSDEIERVAYDMNRLKLNENGFFEYFDENGQKISYNGIDVSRYQGNIDWKKVKNAGVDFAIIRLGYRGMNEGTLEMDPYYEANIDGAAAAGIKTGVYFFSQAITVEEAVEEAQMVLEQIQGHEISYPVIFDTEVVPNKNARANNLPRDLRTQICKAFCDTIAAGGYHPMIYANTRWMILGIDLEKLTEYDKWYAYYGTTFTFPYQYQMLQYSDSGSIPGIAGAVDLDISFIDYSAR